MSALREYMTQKLAGRAASNEKQLHQYLIEIFKKVQDWKVKNTSLVPLSNMSLTEQQKKEIQDLSSEYTCLLELSYRNLTLDHEDLGSKLMLARRAWSLFCITFDTLPYGQEQKMLGIYQSWIHTEFTSIDDNLDYDEQSSGEIRWEMIIKFLLHGRTKQVGKYFKLIDGDTKEYTSLGNLLLNYPRIPNEFLDGGNWAAQWRKWREKVEVLYNEYDRSGVFGREDSAQFHTVMKIIMDDRQAVKRETDTSVWEQCLSSLLYGDPSQHNYNLVELLKFYFSLASQSKADHMLYSMCTGDYDRFLSLADDVTWLQVHLGHLLLTIGYLDTEAEDNEEQQRAVTTTKERVTHPVCYAIRCYAIDIAKEHGLWKEAIQCMMACGPNSEIWIKKLLGDPPLGSEKNECLEDLLNFCIENSLDQVKSTIYSALAKRYEDSNHEVKAATLYAKASDIKALDLMGTKLQASFLENFELKPALTAQEYTNLADQSKPYCYYRRYYESRNYIKNARNDDAFQLIMILLQSLEQAYSNKYRAVLLIDLLGILGECRRLNKQDIQVLLSQLDIAAKDPVQKSFLALYYEQSAPLDAETIVAKLRERLGYGLTIDLTLSP